MSHAPTLEAQFATLTDPRSDHTRRHKLIDIVILAILAVICGADSWTDIAEFGTAREAWGYASTWSYRTVSHRTTRLGASSRGWIPRSFNGAS